MKNPVHLSTLAILIFHSYFFDTIYFDDKSEFFDIYNLRFSLPLNWILLRCHNITDSESTTCRMLKKTNGGNEERRMHMVRF